MKSKNPKNIRRPTIETLIKRLDKIEKTLTLSSIFATFAFIISIMFAIYALAIVTNSLNLFWSGNILLILASLLLGSMIGTVISFKLKYNR